MSCRFCKSESMQKLFNLGTQPLGYPQGDPNISPWVAKLEFEQCLDCGLIQTKNILPEDILTNENQYRSNIASIIRKHDIEFTKKVVSESNLNSNSIIVEIGCGDGSLLHTFKQIGFENVVGIEPAIHLDIDYNFPVYKSYLDRNLVIEKIRKNHLPPDIIIANYLLELVPEINSFMEALYELCASDTRVYIEVPDFESFIDSNRYDGFAHLRSNWFTDVTLKKVFSDSGFFVEKIEKKANYRGGTLLLRARIASQNEKQICQDNAPLLTDIGKRINIHKDGIIKTINQHVSVFGHIYGYGGGLKASTLVHWLGLSSSELKFVVDNDINKHGKYIPLTDINICSIDLLPKDVPVAVINLALDHTEDVINDISAHVISGSILIQPHSLDIIELRR